MNRYFGTCKQAKCQLLLLLWTASSRLASLLLRWKAAVTVFEWLAYEYTSCLRVKADHKYIRHTGGGSRRDPCGTPFFSRRNP